MENLLTCRLFELSLVRHDTTANDVARGLPRDVNCVLHSHTSEAIWMLLLSLHQNSMSWVGCWQTKVSCAATGMASSIVSVAVGALTSARHAGDRDVSCN